MCCHSAIISKQSVTCSFQKTSHPEHSLHIKIKYIQHIMHISIILGYICTLTIGLSSRFIYSRCLFSTSLGSFLYEQRPETRRETTGSEWKTVKFFKKSIFLCWKPNSYRLFRNRKKIYIRGNADLIVP